MTLSHFAAIIASHPVAEPYLHAQASERCDPWVETDGLAICRLDPAPLDTESYPILRRSDGEVMRLAIHYARIGVWAVLFGLLLPYPTAAAPEYLRYYKTGLAAAETEDWVQVDEMMRQAIEGRPEEKQRRGLRRSRYLPHFYLGLARYYLGDCSGAAASWAESEDQGAIVGGAEYAELLRLQVDCQKNGVPSFGSRSSAPGSVSATDSNTGKEQVRTGQRGLGAVAGTGAVAGGRVATPAHIEAIDEVLEALPTGNAAFNSPQEMQLGEPEEIRLLLSTGETLEELKSRIEGLGDRVEGVEVRISDSMEARLSGLSFRIEAMTPERQSAGGKQVTEWRWEVEPQKTGILNLHLTFSVIFEADGRERQRAIRILDQRIEVKVRLSKWLRMFFDDHWEWLIATIILPLLVWLGRHRRREAAHSQKMGHGVHTGPRRGRGNPRRLRSRPPSRQCRTLDPAASPASLVTPEAEDPTDPESSPRQ